MSQIKGYDTIARLSDNTTLFKAILSDPWHDGEPFFIARYLTNADEVDNPYDKKMTIPEVRLFAQNDIKVVSIFQEETYTQSTYTRSKGASDAAKAVAAAAALSQPSGTPIYFATEIELSNSTVTTNVHNYLIGVMSVLSSKTANPKNYKLGVYGPQNTCKKIKEDWYTDAYTMFGHPLGSSYSGWTIRQYYSPTGYSGNLTGKVDFNQSRTSSYGGWLYHQYPVPWKNYGNMAMHRKKCLYCDHYIYEAHTPDSTGSRCTVCGYEGSMITPASDPGGEQDE